MPEDFATELERLINHHRNTGTDAGEIRSTLTAALDAEFAAIDRKAGNDDDAEDDSEEDEDA